MSEAKKDHTLSEDMRIGIDEADRWVTEAAAALGLAYLEHEEARARLEATQANLRSRISTTREAEAQRGHILSKMAKMLNLGPGEWMYDGAGKLVRKGS